MRVVTFPGKIGDALLQWPVIYQHAKTSKTSFHCWLDEHSLMPLVNLLKAQACVEGVELRPGIEHWRCGGQPWDFGLTTDDYVQHEVIHMGMREFPREQITLQTVKWTQLRIDTAALAHEPSLVVVPPDELMQRTDYIVLHGTFASHVSGTPGFWRFLYQIAPWITETFERAIFVGTPSERARARQLYPGIKGMANGNAVAAWTGWSDFDDGGDFLPLASLVSGARMVIGSGSSVVTLAGALKVPCIRVHDAIGEAPKVIWSNLGPNQINETALELRKGAWERFREQWFERKVIPIAPSITLTPQA